MLATAAKRCLFVLTPTRSSIRLPDPHYGQYKLHHLSSSVCTFVRNLFTFSPLRMSDNSEGKALEGEQQTKTAKQMKKDAEKEEKKAKFMAKQAKNVTAVKVKIGA